MEKEQLSERKEEMVEDNLDMVQYIMLHRIYDALTIIGNILAKSDEDKQNIERMVQYHDQGFLLGPIPSFTPQPDEDESDMPKVTLVENPAE